MDRPGRAKDAIERLSNVLIVFFQKDIMINYPNYRYFHKDLETLKKRIDSRGFHFLTKELPSLGKALDRSLVEERWVGCEGFARQRGYQTPRFLRYFWSLLFDKEGRLLSTAEPSVVRDVRQLTYIFYKYELPFDKATIDKSIDTFIDVDRSLPDQLPKVIAPITDLARTLLSELLCDLKVEGFVPQHSNGAVAEKLQNHQKMSMVRDHPRYNGLPELSYLSSYNLHDYFTRGSRLSSVDRIARLSFVPKDSRGPRLICIEPVTQQYIQQGYKDLLYDHVEKHPLTRGHVNFRDQSINGKLAVIGSSLERDTVTLDMKEASDRISNELVSEIFPPYWRTRLLAARTPFVSTAKGTVMLRKYAPMGSALCFPVEALVHWSLAVATVTLAYGYDINRVLKGVFVYGDDIILRGLPYQALYKVFPMYGMRFNQTKSCTEGRFRESCGIDAFKGEDITILKLKKLLPSEPSDPNIIAWAAYADNAYKAGNWGLARAIERTLHESIKQTLPYVLERSSAIGYKVRKPFPELLRFRSKRRRYSVALQRTSVRALKLRDVKVVTDGDRSLYHQSLVDISAQPDVNREGRDWTKSHASKCVSQWCYGVVAPYAG